MPQLAVPRQATYDIFEGTEKIQQLVIARAISGLRIEIVGLPALRIE